MAQMIQSAQERVFQLLRSGQEMTRQEIGVALSLSMPTTLQNVTELMDAGILEEGGSVQSSGGRKAKMIRLRRGAGLAVGINIGVHHVDLVVADLLGELLHSVTLPLVFQDRPDWYAQLREALLAFLAERGIDPETVLGAGVSFPGIIDPRRDLIVRSHILGLTHVELDRFRRHLPFPAVFANDANCACFAERDPVRRSYVYLSLNESVGGAVMLDGALWLGDTFQAGELGHMLLVPGGRRCYCGKDGCADAYLSPQALERDGWEVYLDHLAVFLTDLRMLLDLDLVVGGQGGAEIRPHLEELRQKAAQYDRFARDVDYIFPCARREHARALGAAGFALEEFSARLLDGVGAV